MNAQVLEITQQRRCPRRPVQWEASATIGNLTIQGMVKDYSLMGLFFEPELATDGCEFYVGSSILDQLTEGDTLVVKEKYGIVFESQVRWMGKSQANGCYGIGCEFENVYHKAA
jgi:hypothetical protein